MAGASGFFVCHLLITLFIYRFTIYKDYEAVGVRYESLKWLAL